MRHERTMNPSSWFEPIPAWPTLKHDTIHVWSASLNLNEVSLSRCRECLSIEERQKAASYLFPRDGDRYIAARGLLRILLSRYTGVPRTRLMFSINSHGKPQLANAGEEDRLRFNVSHTKNIALFAVALNREVGVDVEFVRDGVAEQTIAERFFSCYEVRTLRSLPQHEQRNAFFRCWTRKEAYIKARGLGISLPLNSFDVSVVPGAPASLVATRPDPSDKTRWSLHGLNPTPGYEAAVATEGRCETVGCWQLDPDFLSIWRLGNIADSLHHYPE